MRVLPFLLAPVIGCLVAAAPAHAVIDGDPADISAAPYTVALVQTGRSARDGVFCGGSVISPTAILTAAHCVQDQTAGRITVVGSRTRLSDAGPGDGVRVASIALAPGARGTNVPDVAVLRLSRAITAPAVALAPPQDASLLRAGTSVLASGWGLTAAGGDISDVLRVGTATMRSASACQDAYGTDYRPGVMICAGGRQVTCNGDSGGPIVVASASGPVQVGVVSFAGERCGDPATPDVHARVGAQRTWIDRAGGSPATTATALPAATATTGAARTTVRVTSIACPTARCRIVLAVRGATPTRVLVRVRRGGRHPVDRLVVARRSGGGRWVARTGLPVGRLSLRLSTRRADGRLSGPSRTERVDVR